MSRDPRVVGALSDSLSLSLFLSWVWCLVRFSVDTFFFVSGFLVVYAMLRRFKHDSNGAKVPVAPRLPPGRTCVRIDDVVLIDVVVVPPPTMFTSWFIPLGGEPRRRLPNGFVSGTLARRRLRTPLVCPPPSGAVYVFGHAASSQAFCPPPHPDSGRSNVCRRSDEGHAHPALYICCATVAMSALRLPAWAGL